MNTTPTPEQLDQLDQLVQHRQKIATEAKNLEQVRKDYDAKILALAAEIGHEHGSLPVGEHTLTVANYRQLDKKRLATDYPIAQHPEIYAAEISTTAVKKHIAEADLDAYYLDKGTQVRIK